MTKKRWLYLLFIVLLAVPVIILHVAFNGNPLTKFLATKQVHSYLEETYPEEQYRVEKGVYNFKNSGYHFKVIQMGEVDDDRTYEFVVTGLLGNKVSFDGIYHDRLDISLMERLGTEASEEIMEHFKNVDLLEIQVSLEVITGALPDDVLWDKDLPLEKPISIYIALDATSYTEEDMLQATQNIQKTLNEVGYRYDYVNVNGNIPDSNRKTSYVKFALSFKPEENLTLKDIERFNENLEEER